MRFPVFLVAGLMVSIVAVAQDVVVEPQEIDDVLYNPGMGVETMNNFDGDPDPTYLRYPKSRLAYYRPNWSELEPRRGEIDFAKIDRFIEQAVARGQQMSFRVVLSGDGDGKNMPQWFRDQVGGEWYGDIFWPNWESSAFYKESERIIAALAQRYDGHPGIAYWDIGMMGCWGEWNNACTNNTAPKWSQATAEQIVDLHFSYFRQTRLISLTESANGYALERGAGWRGDCFGDYGRFSSTWNHMDNVYAPALEGEHSEVWKRSQITFEVCGLWSSYSLANNDMEKIWSKALEWHGSTLNSKSNLYPLELMPGATEMLKKLGYRLVLREMIHPAAAAPGQRFPISMQWANIGVAPPYQDFDLVLEFTPTQGGEAWRHKVNGADLNSWLPGEHLVEAQVPVPEALSHGHYDVRVGILWRHNQEPAVDLAIAGRDADGWYPLSQILIESSAPYLAPPAAPQIISIRRR